MGNFRNFTIKSRDQEAPKKNPCPRMPDRRTHYCKWHWQRCVSQWEKNFCLRVGLIPWKKVLESKKLITYFEKIANWKDSGAEEAFRNAKTRYWAQINGHPCPCQISVPDPDIYIDEINWDSEIVDFELLSSLGKAIDEHEDEEEEEKFEADKYSHLLLDQKIEPTGWDDVYDFAGPPVLTGLVVGED
ncbi:uncharacterized protein LOC131149178 [Malania oleifera]|uniref:uncharacterized protein LOC131149178 n=1 Tax=Malania oleifera TaxID=397392 RepID=UPI0025AE687A|nr:uncharacterized protein LOC131149178 [Malania oleifera]